MYRFREGFLTLCLDKEVAAFNLRTTFNFFSLLSNAGSSLFLANTKDTREDFALCCWHGEHFWESQDFECHKVLNLLGTPLS